MKDVLTGLAAVAAAFATLAALFVKIDVTKRQNEFASKPGVTIDDALVQAQQHADLQRYVFLVLPCVLALVFSAAAFLVHSSPN